MCAAASAFCAALQSPPRRAASAKAKESRLPKRANGVGRRGGGQARVDHAGAAQRQAVQQAALGVDHRRDAGRRGADHRQPFLERAQPRLGEMLGRAPGAEPGVVGGVEDEVGPVGAVDDLAGEDDLVADLEAGAAEARQIERARPRPVPEIERRRARAGSGRSPRGSAASADIRHKGRDAPCRSGRGSRRAGSSTIDAVIGGDAASVGREDRLDAAEQEQVARADQRRRSGGARAAR